jgi:hypothetical protein
MFKTIIKILPMFMGNRSNHSRINTVTNPKNIDNREGFWTNLVKDDNNFSTVNFFLVAATIVGIALLIVPIFAMCVDVYFNHTITINLSDMAAYIVAVAGIFGAAGLTNAWTEYSYQRYNKNIFSEHQNTESCNGTSIEINNEYRNDI